MDDDALIARVRACHGAVRQADLHLGRTGYRRAAGLVAAGRLRRHGRSVLALPRAHEDVVLARRHGGLITCRHALGHHRLPVIGPPSPLHLVVPHGHRQASVRGEVCHADGELALPGPEVLPVEDVTHAVARYLRCAPQAAMAISAADAALHQRRTTVDQLSALLTGSANHEARARLARTHPGTRSPLETVVRLALEDVGLHVEAAVVIPGLGEVDLLVEGWIVVELDGYEYHSGREQFATDRARDRYLRTHGYLVLRFTADDVWRDHVVPWVTAALRAPVRPRGTNPA